MTNKEKIYIENNFHDKIKVDKDNHNKNNNKG